MTYIGIVFAVIIAILIMILIEKVKNNSSDIFHPSLKTRVISTNKKHSPQILKRYLGFNWWGYFYYEYDDPEEDDECSSIEHKIKCYDDFLQAKQHCIYAVNDIKPSEKFDYKVTEIT